MKAETRQVDGLGSVHDCVSIGCDVSLDGFALWDLEVYVVRDKTVEVVSTETKDAPMAGRAGSGKWSMLQTNERPFTRRKVA